MLQGGLWDIAFTLGIGSVLYARYDGGEHHGLQQWKPSRL